jgi:hypothetical protein
VPTVASSVTKKPQRERWSMLRILALGTMITFAIALASAIAVAMMRVFFL